MEGAERDSGCEGMRPRVLSRALRAAAKAAVCKGRQSRFLMFHLYMLVKRKAEITAPKLPLCMYTDFVIFAMGMTLTFSPETRIFD